MESVRHIFNSLLLVSDNNIIFSFFLTFQVNIFFCKFIEYLSHLVNDIQEILSIYGMI